MAHKPDSGPINKSLQTTHILGNSSSDKPEQISLLTFFINIYENQTLFIHLTPMPMQKTLNFATMAGPHSVDRKLPKTKISKQALLQSLQLFRYMSKTNRWLFALGTVFLAVTAAASLAFPKLLGEMMDTANVFKGKETNANPEKIKEIASYFIYLFIVQAVFSFGRIALYVRVTEDLTFGLRKDLFSAIIKQNMQFFHGSRVGDLMSRFSADIAQIQDAFTTNLAMFIRQILVLLGGIVVLFTTSPTLAWLMLATLPAMIGIALVFGRFIRKKSTEVQDLTAGNNIIVEETLSGIESVKAFTNESFEIQRYTNNAFSLKNYAITRGYWRGAFSSFIIVCMFGVIVWLIYQGLSMVQHGDMKIGELFNFMILTAFVGSSIGGMAEQFVQIQKTLGSIDRVLQLIDTPGEDSNAIIPDNQTKPDFKQSLSFNNLHFTYPGEHNPVVLNNLSFTINPGETVALVGSSGSGKSTIVNLVYQFYQPSQGSITLGNIPLSDFNLNEYRNHFALVPQEVLLFGGTILENIRYGKPNASDEEVKEAAKLANALDFILSFPKGFDSVVGDRGVLLSGGQKQRIAIARAILRNPAFLILDEATSALDSESELQVQKALSKLMQNRTSLVIAHRLSTIRNANTIILLKQGRIHEIGSHETLMNLENSVYRKMVEQQLNPEEFFDKL
ncbi:MAG: ABC transporter ATP-binding protein [Bacteroidota bacterium]|jgi:ABC-type multidrug transport system fused ATPase/permease subunit